VPACPGGATPRPGSAGVQVWLDIATFLANVIAIITAKIPWAATAYAAQLVRIDDLCAANEDPPPALTTADIIESTASFISGGVLGQNKVLQWMGAAARYEAFLQFCQCNAPGPPPASACPYQNATITIPVAGDHSVPVPYSIPDNIYSTWPVSGTPPDQLWRFGRSCSFTTGPTASNQLLISYQVGAQFFIVDDLFFSGAPPSTCTESPQHGPAPFIPQSGFVRLENRSGGSFTTTGFNYCFCGLASVPPVLPPPAIDAATPDAPAPFACSNADLCLAINELNRRLTIISTEVSDLVAAGGTSQLRVLATQQISGEGTTSLVPGTRAVAVQLPGVPSSSSVRFLANPDELFEVGALRWGNGQGFTRREIVDSLSFTSTRPTGALTLTWSLLSGITATLEQLG
jgi:hypothetical protein